MIDLFGEQKENIRALSWKQPYAELMFHGKIETRTWNTNYRGLVLICASKKSYHRDEVIAISGSEQLKRIEAVLGKMYSYRDTRHHTGVAIGIGELVDCRPMAKEDSDLCFVEYCRPEIDGLPICKPLYCHIYQNVRRITPIPWTGSQGWKTVDIETQKLIGLI